MALPTFQAILASLFSNPWLAIPPGRVLLSWLFLLQGKHHFNLNLLGTMESW
jgi:hypothetical protein